MAPSAITLSQFLLEIIVISSLGQAFCRSLPPANVQYQAAPLAFPYPIQGHSPHHTGYYSHPIAQVYQPLQPAGTFYDSNLGILRSLQGGGVPVLVDHHRRCSGNFVGIKPHPKHRQYYYDCKADCVIFRKCQNLQFFDATKGQCSTYPTPAYTPVCTKPGSFAILTDCTIYYKCDAQLKPRIYSCPLNTIFSTRDGKCVCGAQCSPTEVSDSGSYIPQDCEHKFPPCLQDGTFRVPTDCSLYYTCAMQKKGIYSQTRFKCPEHTFFDTAQRVCRPQHEVACDCIQLSEVVYPRPPALPNLPVLYPPYYSADSLEDNAYPIEYPLSCSNEDITGSTVESSVGSTKPYVQPLEETPVQTTPPTYPTSPATTIATSTIPTAYPTSSTLSPVLTTAQTTPTQTSATIPIEAYTPTSSSTDPSPSTTLLIHTSPISSWPVSSSGEIIFQSSTPTGSTASMPPALSLTVSLPIAESKTTVENPTYLPTSTDSASSTYAIPTTLPSSTSQTSFLTSLMSSTTVRSSTVSSSTPTSIPEDSSSPAFPIPINTTTTNPAMTSALPESSAEEATMQTTFLTSSMSHTETSPTALPPTSTSITTATSQRTTITTPTSPIPINTTTTNPAMTSALPESSAEEATMQTTYPTSSISHTEASLAPTTITTPTDNSRPQSTRAPIHITTMSASPAEGTTLQTAHITSSSTPPATSSPTTSSASTASPKPTTLQTGPLSSILPSTTPTQETSLPTQYSKASSPLTSSAEVSTTPPAFSTSSTLASASSSSSTSTISTTPPSSSILPTTAPITTASPTEVTGAPTVQTSTPTSTSTTTVNPFPTHNRSTTSGYPADAKDIPKLEIAVFGNLDLTVLFCPKNCSEIHEHKYDKKVLGDRHVVGIQWNPVESNKTISFRTV